MKPSGTQLKEAGIQQAVDNAGSIWASKAYRLLCQCPLKQFLAENVREWAYKRGLEKPPSERSWGAIIRRARTEGIIKFMHIAHVTNPRAHTAMASVWRKV